jgi:hypothetical protein
MGLLIYAITFVLVFVVNLIPIFGPPTWTILSFIVFNYHTSIPSLPLLVIVGVVAAAAGRYGLILSSRKVIRNRLLSIKAKENIDHLYSHFKRGKWVASGIFLLDALTPLPSDQLFIAFGLTKFRARYALIPFICGRLVTYSIWVYTADFVSKSVSVSSLGVFSFLSGSVILVELVLIFLIYLFVKIDWQHLFLTHRFRFYH